MTRLEYCTITTISSRHASRAPVNWTLLNFVTHHRAKTRSKMAKSTPKLQNFHCAAENTPNLDGFVSSEHLLKSVHTITRHTSWTNGRNSTVIAIKTSDTAATPSHPMIAPLYSRKRLYSGMSITHTLRTIAPAIYSQFRTHIWRGPVD